MYSFCAMNSFRMSFWSVPEIVFQSTDLALREHQIHREHHRRRGVDRHRRRDVAERDAVEQRFHVGERRDVDAALPRLAERQRMVRIAPHQRRQIERDAQSRRARREQLAIPAVRVLRRAEPRKLPHRPELPSVAGRMNAPRVWIRARIAELAVVVELWNAFGRVETLDRTAGDGLEGLGCCGARLKSTLRD